jgi:hypothetical protein
LQAVQPLAHGVQIHHHFPGVFGQAAGALAQQAGCDAGRILRQLGTAGAFIVGQLQPVKRAGRRQGDAARGGIAAVLAQRIAFVTGGGQQGIAP